MDLLQKLLEEINRNTINKRVYAALSAVIFILGFFLILGTLFPTVISLLLNVVWVLLLIIVITFFSLGTLVIIGLRKEVSQILDVLLEGSLTILDLVEFLKELGHRFLQLAREFILFAIPTIAYIVSFAIYILVLLLYKVVGKTHDVTILTVVLTVFLVFTMVILIRPNNVHFQITNWMQALTRRFSRALSDGFEVVLFLFFLTMDSTNLFFLPDDLNNELHANIGDYNLMLRSFVVDEHFRITINLIIITITTEIIRKLLRIVYCARVYYAQKLNTVELVNKVAILKQSMRQSFGDSKDDLIKFLAFTTFLFLVFLFFPRLKLFTLAIASITTLFLDLLVRRRLTEPRGADLVSRILTKVLRV